jgi:hypothetical protein
MSDLITSARAKQNIPQASFSSSENTQITSLVTAVSVAVQRYCHRDFTSTSYDELYQGDSSYFLLLKQLPLISVARVATTPTVVLQVRNTGVANQRATASVTSTGLSLTRVASGVSSTDTSVTFTSYPTFAQMATAIAALGNGWEAQALDPYTLWPTADLLAPQGALNAMTNWCQLQLHVEEISDFDVDTVRGRLKRRGEMYRDIYDWPTIFYPLPVWQVGREYRVQYTAGYAAIPDDVMEACAEWVAWLFELSKRDPAYRSQSSVPASSDTTDPTVSYSYDPLQGPPPHVAALLNTYRKRLI